MKMALTSIDLNNRKNVMSKMKLIAIPALCDGCRLCELICSLKNIKNLTHLNQP